MQDFAKSGKATSRKKHTRTALVTYAGTMGTTAAIAEAITEGMNALGASASAIHVERLSIVPSRVHAADILGVGTPVYFLREPAYMGEFIADLPRLDGKKAFVFCTTGMNRPGETLQRLETLLSERGAVIVGAEQFPTAMSYPPYRRRGLGNPDSLPDEAVLAKARSFGQQMVKAPSLESITLKTVSLADRLTAKLLAHKSIRRSLLPGIRIDHSLCTGYGSCISRCLFGALARPGEEDIPEVTDACVQCLQCIDSCPRSAIVLDSRIKDWFSTLTYRLKIH
jgi:ferredoxin/multimeric flavodoxin WrbA